MAQYSGSSAVGSNDRFTRNLPRRSHSSPDRLICLAIVLVLILIQLLPGSAAAWSAPVEHLQV